MQKVSKAYREAMKNPFRNRSYINIAIGVVNQNAQKTAKVDASETPLAYFSNASKPFNGFPTDSLYATAEENFSKVDGSMAFLPRSAGNIIHNNGIVSDECFGSILIEFGTVGLDIKGLTIDFGECFPTSFTVENDSEIKQYKNTSRKWNTEDVFNGTSFFKITPISMVNGISRLRIHEMLFGIGKTFTNKDVKSFLFKDYVSPISENLPSQDMSLTVFNYDGEYNADNPDSALNYMEKMQEISVSFGYDVTGNGDIEWVDGNELYLKSWSADDKEAVFTATDRFDYMSGMFYKGKYRSDGISAYELAVEVFEDAGIPSDEYYIDPYLKNIMIYNPIPPVSHPEALQLIANACRCVLYGDRSRKIHLQSSFVPDMAVVSNGETEFSNVENILSSDEKTAYAIASSGFTKVDGSLMFLPAPGNYLRTGYVSAEVSDSAGYFQENPKITISLEAEYISYGLLIRFRNIAPLEFMVRTYHENVLVKEFTVNNPDLEYVNNEIYDLYDQMEIIFTKSNPYTRVTIDHLKLGDVTNYTLTYSSDLKKTPIGTRQDKINEIRVTRNVYEKSSQNDIVLLQEEIELSPEENEYVAYLSLASYSLTAQVIDNTDITCEILDNSDYYVHLKFTGITQTQKVKYAIKGKEYVVKEVPFIKKHHPYGETIIWTNPLISSFEMAKELESWLATHFLGDMDYLLYYRGNPEFDANDLFYLELKNRDNPLIRAYQHELSFAGALNGSIKARKAVV